MVDKSISRRSEESQFRHEVIQKWEESEKSKKRSCCGMSCFSRNMEMNSIPNRHEHLFLFGKSGPSFSRVVL